MTFPQLRGLSCEGGKSSPHAVEGRSGSTRRPSARTPPTSDRSRFPSINALAHSAGFRASCVCCGLMRRNVRFDEQLANQVVGPTGAVRLQTALLGKLNNLGRDIRGVSNVALTQFFDIVEDRVFLFFISRPENSIVNNVSQNLPGREPGIFPPAGEGSAGSREALIWRSFVDASMVPPISVRKRSAGAPRGLHQRIRRAGGCRLRAGDWELE